jgi:large subunit ribosomal protein L17
MRHHKVGKKFGRKRDQRRALLRSLAEGLIEHGRIQTTQARAKELRRFIEPLVTRARTGTLVARRLVTSRLGTVKRSKKLFDEIAPRYRERPGGYTRVVKLAPIAGSSRTEAIIEWV